MRLAGGSLQYTGGGAHSCRRERTRRHRGPQGLLQAGRAPSRAGPAPRASNVAGLGRPGRTRSSPHLLPEPLGDGGGTGALFKHLQARTALSRGAGRRGLLEREPYLGAAWTGQAELHGRCPWLQRVRHAVQGNGKRARGAGCRGPGRERRAERKAGKTGPASPPARHLQAVEGSALRPGFELAHTIMFLLQTRA